MQGRDTIAKAEKLEQGTDDASGAIYERTTIFVDGKDHSAQIYDRSNLKSGNRISGPAIITEMDSTTLLLPNHAGEVDDLGNILIRPENGA